MSRSRPLASNLFCARLIRCWPSPKPATRSWSGRECPRLVLDDPDRGRAHFATVPAPRRRFAVIPNTARTSSSRPARPVNPRASSAPMPRYSSYFADHRDRVYRAAATRLGRPLRIAHAWSLSFDASWQPMVGLLDGHALHLFDADEMRDADRLVKGMAAHGIDMIDTTPSMLGATQRRGTVGPRSCGAGPGRRSDRQRAVGAVACAAGEHGLQLLRAHRDDGRGGGGPRSRNTRRRRSARRTPEPSATFWIRRCGWCPTAWWASFICPARSWPAAMPVGPQ